MALFERGGKPKRHDDNQGSVRVTIRLLGKGGKVVIGNIGRNLTVKNAKVSEVTEAITEFLFGGDDE
ncbi:MAG: hypothetical protein Unbinned1606contig1000_12 [Prokaryotic dsDNA virus sp.]|nr:MAG: hypothetical protein Unbinned1606contig1000_12 [Prokaryotic dsDNA virus sp.]|tara:strand:- start:53819 stop:54019 length:201 start_codon:yes stop_codon:yes gene_type:complete